MVGGGPSSPALVEEARRRFGADYSIRYSSTESGGVGTGTAFDADDHEALHTVGRPRGEVEVEIRDESGQPVPDGEVGQVHLRSGAVMTGYWGDPEASAVALPGDGWLRTGDLGTIDARGCLVLAGRTGEMFIRGGYNVYPMEVEAVLGQHPGVAAGRGGPPTRSGDGRGGRGRGRARRPGGATRRWPTSVRSHGAGWRRTSCPTTWWRCPSSRSPRCRRSTAGPSPPS